MISVEQIQEFFENIFLESSLDSLTDLSFLLKRSEMGYEQPEVDIAWKWFKIGFCDGMRAKVNQ